MGILGFRGIGYNEAQRSLCSWVPSTRPRCFGVLSRESVSLLQYLCLSGFLFIFAPELGTIEIESISCIDLFSWLCVIQTNLCVCPLKAFQTPRPNSKNHNTVITMKSSQWYSDTFMKSWFSDKVPYNV